LDEIWLADVNSYLKNSKYYCIKNLAVYNAF